jgi:hypothetical protein
MTMGFGTPKGAYSRGKKRYNRTSKYKKPTFKPIETAKPSDVKHTTAVKPTDEALIKVLAQMSDHDMSTFVTATAFPKPTDVLIVRGNNGRPKPIVLDDDDDRQTHSGMVYVAGLGFGGGSAPHHVPESTPPIVGVATIKPTAVRVESPKAEQKEKVIGEIVRKPNGEIVLRFF